MNFSLLLNELREAITFTSLGSWFQRLLPFILQTLSSRKFYTEQDVNYPYYVCHDYEKENLLDLATPKGCKAELTFRRRVKRAQLSTK